MGKRRFSKQQRHLQEQKVIGLSEVVEMREKIRESAIKETYDSILPLCALYLVDNFRCKEKGILKFMDWFNATAEWVNGDPEKIEEIKKELAEKANVGISY